jgi:outer membrane protein assembly factor BamB
MLALTITISAFACDSAHAQTLPAKTASTETAKVTQLWNFTTDYPQISSPVVADGMVYFASTYDITGDGYVYCVNATNGVQLWKQDVFLGYS